ncbi:hypothetical protein GCM10023063_01300 [Arthrobacter methylotrophus]
MSDDELSALRAHRIGFIFQQFHLLDGATALENVANGMLYCGVDRSSRRRRAAEALDAVGLSHRRGHRPHQLSGGERQRVAIARAVVSRPRILLADEPTGNLDRSSGAAVMEILRKFHNEGTTVIVITHDPELAAQMPRRVSIQDGKVLADTQGTPQ